ncbi:MAG TPA: PadR family transcriptional regulator [Dehalococcoidia bacterium]|nr:PadR family transcriptional regulator [Dehalococcoidia bacterium]
MSERALLPGEFAILGVLALRPMHGYEMLNFFESESLIDVCPVEHSTLYTYLRNLETRDLVGWKEERVGLRPPRKIFELDPAGWELLQAWLREPVERMREIRLEFLLKLFFLERTDQPALERLVDGQLQVCETYLTGLNRREAGTEFSRLVDDSKRSAAEATLGWLNSYRLTLGNR